MDRVPSTAGARRRSALRGFAAPFPGQAVAGILDGGGIHGRERRATFVTRMPTALAVHLARVTVGAVREHRTPARAEVAG